MMMMIMIPCSILEFARNEVDKGHAYLAAAKMQWHPMILHPGSTQTLALVVRSDEPHKQTRLDRGSTMKEA
jgi:hypothetical protein